jgi:hypothetical protein
MAVKIKAVPTLFLAEALVTKVSEEQLAFFCFGILSNPINERYRSLFEGKHNLLDILNHMQGKKEDKLILKVCNGTKEVKNSLAVWREIVTFNLRHYISDPKNPACNVVINVTAKKVEKVDSNLSAF